MSSIPNSVIPHAAPSQPTAGRSLFDNAARLALMPPLIALGATAYAFSALRSLAKDWGRKVEASAGSASSPVAQNDSLGVPV